VLLWGIILLDLSLVWKLTDEALKLFTFFVMSLALFLTIPILAEGVFLTFLHLKIPQLGHAIR